ncbi:MAG: DUF262 domain-containing protein [Bacteroidota bacterium]
MDYKNSEMKIDQLIGYLNDGKINLSPAFQRGHVWNLNLRRKLLKNILDRKPIPAIFLYKEASGAKYSYNILDGKQRLESIILYVNNSRNDLAVKQWQDYFLVAGRQRDQAGFSYDRKDSRTCFSSLNEAIVRDFREYSIPTIEITLKDDSSSSVSEIISLFIDINQQGVRVSRFNIVKALCLDSELLKSVFNIIAQKQKRRKDPYYKLIDNDINRVIKRLRDVQAVQDPNFKADKIWEHLLELALFCETSIHRKPIDITKGFINKKEFTGIKLSSKTIKTLKRVFALLNSVSRRTPGQSPFFSDYAYFYTIATHLTRDGVITQSNQLAIIEKLVLLAKALNDKPRSQSSAVKRFASPSKQHSVELSVRDEREKRLKEILKGPKSNLIRGKK